MSNFKRILFIDDEYDDFKAELEASFGQKTDIVCCPTKDSALEAIDSKKHFDLIILDWYLEEPDISDLSQLVLKYLQNKYFVPVFIWSNHIENFKETLNSGVLNYPRMLIIGISKEEISAATIKDKFAQWLSTSLTAQISDIYRNSINENLERTFFELAEIPNEDIASILKILVGSEESIDWSNDFILNLIHRKLLADNTFTTNLKTLINAASDNLGNEEPAKRRRIINKVLYYQSSPNIIRCGDIIKIQKDGDVLQYGIIVTPDCDIEQKRTRYLEIIELKKIDDEKLNLTPGQKDNISKYNNESLYYFPSISIDGDIGNDFVAVLKAKFVIEGLYENNNEKYPGVPQKLNYSGEYLYKDKKVQLIHICSKSNPYKSDFLQKLYANNSRVGIPDIKDLLKP